MDMAAMVHAVQRVYEAARLDPGIAPLCVLCGLFAAYAEAAREEVIRRQEIGGVTEKGTDTGQCPALSVSDVAKRLDCSRWVVHERIRTGKLRAIRDGRIKIEEAELERYKTRYRR